MRIVEVDPGADPRWDRYVREHPGGLVYHHSTWLAVLTAESARPVVALAAVDAEDRVRGVLPLVRTRGVPVVGRRIAALGPRLASLPRTAVAGPLADDDATTAALLADAVHRTGHGTQLQVKPATTLTDPLPAGLVGRSWRVAYAIELPAHVEDLPYLKGRASRGLRSRLAKARRSGVIARDAASPAELETWYRLYLATMRENLVPARPLRTFRAMWDLMRPQGLMRLVVAELDGEIVAGALTLQLGGTAFYAFGATRADRLRLSPADVVQASLIEDAVRAGLRRYDLGEVPEGNEGLAAFKRKWGAEPARLVRYYHPPAVAPAGSGYGDESHAGASLAVRTWGKVPLGATAAAGDLAYRFL